MTGIVAIVSQGPKTFPTYRPSGRYAAVIGVNAVPCVHRCDYWVSSDWHTFGKYLDGCEEDGLGPVIASPRIVTRANMPERISERAPDVFERIGDRMSTDEGFPVRRTTNYSGPLALSLAFSLKPNAIECFGCDIDGARDFLNRLDNVSRQPTRWASERLDWNRMARLIGAHGVGVYHATPDGGMVSWSERAAA